MTKTCKFHSKAAAETKKLIGDKIGDLIIVATGPVEYVASLATGRVYWEKVVTCQRFPVIQSIGGTR